jgi:hypothetical protein
MPPFLTKALWVFSNKTEKNDNRVVVLLYEEKQLTMTELTRDEKLAYLQKLFDSYNMEYDEYNEYIKSNVDSFYNMYAYDVVDTSLSPRYIGNYYAFFKKDNDNPEIEKYYKLAANNEDWRACNNYAWALHNFKKDYANPDIITYYKLAADNGHWDAAHNYAYFLNNIKKEYDNPDIIKYCKLAADNGVNTACNNYACFLECIKKDYDNPDIEIYYEKSVFESSKDIIIICKNYTKYLKAHTEKTAKKTAQYRALAYETGHFNYICMLSKLAPKPYLGNISLYITQMRPRTQWKRQRRVETLAECPICYNTTGTLYRYACTIHMYCCTCYRKMQHTQKCCAQCRMKEHPDYAAIFN